MNSFWLFLAAGVLILFTACTSNKPYRTSLTPCDTKSGADCRSAVIEVADDYKLGFVEFDDQGWFWNTNQLAAVRQMIRTEAGLDEPAKAEGIVIVLFVHGWKNNAAYDNKNVQMVRSTLSDLNQAEKAESSIQQRKARRVVGVYGGWRGLSARLEPFKELSFYERKNTAHKIGYGAVTELLIRLDGLQAESNRRISAGAPKSELIIVGHSFGGALVYSAISQVVTERFVASIVERQQRMKPVGDLVILLNPAFEASRYDPVNELAASVGRYPETQRPVLAVFTSKADWATKYFFPLGRIFSTLFEKTRHDKAQRSAVLKAVGHFQPFITHDLVYDATVTNHSTFNPDKKKHERHTPERFQESIQNVRSLRDRWRANTVTGPAKPVAYAFDDCRLEARPNYVTGDPLLVVYVDKKIMKGHNDIANPVLLNFLREFIQFSRTNPVKQAGE